MEVLLNDENFEEEVLKSELPVLVDFWAEWCTPCLMVAPAIEEISRKYAGRLKVGKLNVDENPLTSAKYGIQSIPTFIIFKNGEVLGETAGAMPREALEEKIGEILGE
ncbi:MAG: thioredoxin [Elusimicrobiota bacterium]|nr:thioredoxin [Elusimicrobiota bacterium]